MSQRRMHKTFDADLELKDSGAVTADGAAQIDGSDRIVYIGTGYLEGDIIVDCSSVKISASDEGYVINVQVSSEADFSSDVYTVASYPLGHASSLLGDTNVVEGRHIISFSNMIVDGECKGYMRLYTGVSGTSPSIDYSAYAAID